MRHALVISALSLILLSGATPTSAQLVLPGAVAPTAEGAPGASEVPAKDNRPKPHKRSAEAADTVASPPPAKVPRIESLAGQTLYRDGGGSEISFALRDKALVVSRVTLAGRGDDGAECRIDVADLPLSVRDEGRPDGMARIGIALPACPISFDVMDGAALETGDRAACAFKEAHCTVDPTGLWGPPASSLTPARDKTIERERARAEAAVRASFKRLVATTKDRPTIMGYAREQAQFSSTREETCRGYAGELKHGFCSTRVTEARAASLHAKADLAQAEKDKRKNRRSPRD